jgi:hypothetical protein
MKCLWWSSGLGSINKNNQIREIFRKKPENLKPTISVRKAKKII